MIQQDSPPTSAIHDPEHNPETTAIPADSSHPTTTSIPFICRRPVRIVMYTILGAFVAFMLAWGFLPPLLDPTFEQHIQDKEVIAGMTRDQAMEAWGSPYQMNVTYTDRGVRREEWIYEDWIEAGTVRHRYLYFEEGILVGGWYYD